MEGKIFFGVLARRLVNFVVINECIDTSVQKAGVPGFPGCLEYVAMIRDTIRYAREDKKDLYVIWLDLANAYRSGQHHLIAKALDFFWVPNKVREVIVRYYNGFLMCFSAPKYTTKWQELEVGTPMGCVISQLLFVMVMEVIIHGTKGVSTGVV